MDGSPGVEVRIKWAMSSVKLAISGMTCEGCVRTVERRLKSVPGVHAAKVNLAANEADVDYSPGAVSPDDLTAAVEKLGYQATAK